MLQLQNRENIVSLHLDLISVYMPRQIHCLVQFNLGSAQLPVIICTESIQSYGLLSQQHDIFAQLQGFESSQGLFFEI